MGPTRAGGIPHGASVAAVGLRSRSVVAAGAFLFLVVLSGCAGTMTTPAAITPCVPSGMPPVATWAMQDGRVVAMRTPEQRTVFVVLIDYLIGATHARGLWLGLGLIVVDPDADDPGRRVWRDQGALNAQWMVLGPPTCDWVEDSGRRA